MEGKILAGAMIQRFERQRAGGRCFQGQWSWLVVDKLREFSPEE